VPTTVTKRYKEKALLGQDLISSQDLCHKGSIVPLVCSDFYLFSTVAEYHFGTFPTPIPGTKSYHFPSDKLTPAEKWDIETKGVRVFKFRGDGTTSAAELAKTLTMFTPLIGHFPVAPGESATAATTSSQSTGTSPCSPGAPVWSRLTRAMCKLGNTTN